MSPTKQSVRKRGLLTAAIVAGVAASITWIFVRRWQMAVQETEVTVATTAPSPSSLNPQNTDGDRPLQLLEAGHGPVYHRDYQVDILHPTLSKDALMERVKQDIDHFTPGELARFEKTKGEAGKLQVGDEFCVHIRGPWNGPVRVIDVQPNSLSFITLEGHLEAGEIQFRVLDHPQHDDALRFEIRSWARSSDSITDFFYRTLGISKYSQTRMWAYFCKQVAAESGGEIMGKINIMTHKTDYHPESASPAWKQYTSQFEHWGAAKLNFDPSKREDFTQVNGWHVDDYTIGLPSELPGKPVPGGSWEAAKSIMLNYEFPDPSLVTGVFVPDNPLKDRIMIIRARFLVFTFLFGVRVSQVVDEQRDSGKRGAGQVWGYGYSTLSGHFEMGEITFEVWKFLESGEVEFRIHAYSKTAFIPNPFYRLGFRIFGRSLQRRFARTALARMQQLVIERLAKRTSSDQPLERPTVQSVSADQDVSDKAEEIRHQTN